MRPILALAALLLTACASRRTDKVAVPHEERDLVDRAGTEVEPDEAEDIGTTDEETVRAPRTPPSVGGEDDAPEDTGLAREHDDHLDVGAPEEGPEAPPAGWPEGMDGSLRPPPRGLLILPNDHWQIPQHLMDRWEAHPFRIARLARADNGWKLRRVRPGGAGWWLGLRDGDVLVTVNGMKMNNKVQQAAAYLKLRNQTEFVVILRRDGVLRTHRYTIIE